MVTKKSFMLAVVMMMSTIIFAQHKGDDKSHDEGQAEKMKAELSLSDVQYTNIKSIHQKYKDKHKAIKKDSTLTGESKANKLKALKDEREKEVNAVLTPEQITQWKAYKAEKKEARKEHRAEVKEAHEAKLKSDLSLSDEQFTKLQAANKSFKEKRKALPKESAKSEHKKLADEHLAAVKAILTPEQFQKWQTMNEEKKQDHKGEQKK
jgi:hypothetical protein